MTCFHKITVLLFYITMVMDDVLCGVTAFPFRGCEYGNQVFRVGEKFMKNECEPCVCDANLGISCVAIMCQDSACVDAMRIQGECCVVCPNGPNCRYGNQTIPANRDVVVEGLRCRCPDVKGYPPRSSYAVCT